MLLSLGRLLCLIINTLAFLQLRLMVHLSKHRALVEEGVSLPHYSNSILGGNSDFIGMRLRGLPFTVSPTDISNFF